MFCCPCCCIGAAVRLALFDCPILDAGRIWDGCLQDSRAGHTGEATRILIPCLPNYIIPTQSVCGTWSRYCPMISMERPQWCSGMLLYYVAFQVGTAQNLLISYHLWCVLLYLCWLQNVYQLFVQMYGFNWSAWKLSCSSLVAGWQASSASWGHESWVGSLQDLLQVHHTSGGRVGPPTYTHRHTHAHAHTTCTHSLHIHMHIHKHLHMRTHTHMHNQKLMVFEPEQQLEVILFSHTFSGL